MKLSKKNIGELFDVEGGDGSWYYQLLDVKKGKLLFRAQNGKYWIFPLKNYFDWRGVPFQGIDRGEVQLGWMLGREEL